MHTRPNRSFFLFLMAVLAVLPLFSQEKNELPSSEKAIQEEYNRRIVKEKINGVYIPRNLDDVFLTLDKMVDGESKTKVKDLPESRADSVLLPRLGLWMKLNWSFYDGSRLSHYLRSAGVSFPDDQASFLILAWHRHLNGKPVEIKELATFFKSKRAAEFETEKRKGVIIHEEKRPKSKGK